MLYIIASPIGNLGDISMRALEVLKTVDSAASEDTRRTRKLFDHYGITTPLMSYHDHSSPQKREKLIGDLQDGKKLALISDAGTPLINDPGFKLVKRCIEEKIEITAVPGPCSPINAIVLSGLGTDRFIYWGYLPHKSGKRKKDLEYLLSLSITAVVLESPHRIVKALDEMQGILGDRQIAVCREMTKKFEEIFRGTSREAYEHFSKATVKGEFVVVISSK
ncbi:16S rRNA (cytidine(1402)-2'-O)-methyltransferase [Candidatus Omnitrophota bacterium]